MWWMLVRPLCCHWKADVVGSDGNKKKECNFNPIYFKKKEREREREKTTTLQWWLVTFLSWMQAENYSIGYVPQFSEHYWLSNIHFVWLIKGNLCFLDQLWYSFENLFNSFSDWFYNKRPIKGSFCVWIPVHGIWLEHFMTSHIKVMN